MADRCASCGGPRRAGARAAAPDADRPPAPRTAGIGSALKLLFVGNSYIYYYNDLPRMSARPRTKDRWERAPLRLGRAQFAALFCGPWACAGPLRLRAPARLVSAAAPCCLHTGTAFPRLGVTVARRASRAVPASPWADPGLGLLWFLWRVHLSRQQCICAGSSIRARWPVVSAAWSAYLCGSLLG